MFKKILLAFMVMLGFASSPQKAQASIPIGEIVEGAKAAKEIFDVAQPLLVRCGKALKKACKRIVRYIKSRRGKQDRDVYVNPMRTAVAAANDEYVEAVLRRRYGQGQIDIDESRF